MSMNREIKFRGKSQVTNEWMYGSLVKIGNESHIIGFDEVDLDGHHLIYCCDRPVFTCQCTICQFTGLHDKNGREIYEGDILRSVRFKDIIIMVVYDEEEASFMAVQINKNIGTDLETRCHITQDWINRYPKVVIGNIYDNKELLNE